MNLAGEDLGKIEDLIVDATSGSTVYAVLSFGGFLGMGDKLFALPWASLTVDAMENRVILDVDKDLLKRAPGFDKDQWPDMADRTWGSGIYTYYKRKPYWD